MPRHEQLSLLPAVAGGHSGSAHALLVALAAAPKLWPACLLLPVWPRLLAVPSAPPRAVRPALLLSWPVQLPAVPIGPPPSCALSPPSSVSSVLTAGF